MKTIKSQLFNEQQQSNNKVFSKYFIGDCVTGLNSSNFRDKVAKDATELAQLVENGEEISEIKFFNIASPTYDVIQKLNGNYKYYYNSVDGVAWIYDGDNDIKYFYG